MKAWLFRFMYNTWIDAYHRVPSSQGSSTIRVVSPQPQLRRREISSSGRLELDLHPALRGEGPNKTQERP